MHDTDTIEESNDSSFSAPATEDMVEIIVNAMRQRQGDDWGIDEEMNLHFSLDAAAALREVDGAHLIGEPETDNGALTLTFWVDFQIEDVMAVDQLAFEIFSRISDEFFFCQRVFETKTIRYKFVTGSDNHGHVGSVVLAGSYAAEFVDREKVRTTGTVRFHA